MSAEILKFPTPKFVGARPPAQKPTGPRYFCRTCEASLFTALESGKVHCGNCGMLIVNLEIVYLA